MRMKLLLLCIIILAFFLRSYRFNDVPLSLNRDEVGLGYDAYSLLKTGRDQFNIPLPITLRSSDDYKPAVYTYLDIPSLAIFDLDSVGVRLPSVMFGVFAIFGVYVLTQRLFNHTKISLLSALLLAISPWHIQFSRTAFEANISLFFLILGVYFFLLMGKSKSFVFAFLSSTFFGLGLFTYHAARFIIPAIILFLLFVHWRDILEKRKNVFFFMFLFGLYFLFILPILFSSEAQIRLRTLSIFNQSDYAQETEKLRRIDVLSQDGQFGKVFHNQMSTRLSIDSLKFSTNYIRHLEPQTILFGTDDITEGGRASRIQSHHAPDMGVVYPWEILFFGVGFILVFRYSRPLLFLLPFWFIVGFIPAAITWDIPSYVRAILVLPSIQIIASLAIFSITAFLQRRLQSGQIFFSLLVACWCMFTLSYFLHQYFIHLNIENAQAWKYGRRETFLETEKLKDHYKKIVVSTSLDDPHLFFLFHLKIDPKAYLSSGGTVKGGWTATENHYQKYEFHPIPDQNTFSHDAQAHVLYVGIPREISPEAKVVKTIYYPDGTEAIKLVEKS